MHFFSLFKELIKAKKISSYSRKEVLAIREKRLRETLVHAYDNSPFYRNLWDKAGIKRKSLKDIPIVNIPVVSKREIMESFESVITRPGIAKKDVELFIQEDAAGDKLYKNKYIVLNTSGSSGYTGIFLFEQSFLNRLVASILTRIIKLKLSSFLKGRKRIAFAGEKSGHHAGINLVKSAPSFLFRTLAVSVGDDEVETISKLNKFQPHLFVGYASALASIAEAQLSGKLKINPETIISSGEPLTKERHEIIKKAFGIDAIDLYSATECLAIGADKTGQGKLDIFDEIIFLEVIDDKGLPVQAGKSGRVVLTVFGNEIQPLIRYVLDDQLILIPEKENNSSFTRAKKVSGRSLERLIFTSKKGGFEIQPMELVGLFFPRLKQYQIIQTGPKSATLKLAASGDKEKIKERVHAYIAEMLKAKGASEYSVILKIEFVKEILPDPRTGKTPIIITLRGKK